MEQDIVGASFVSWRQTIKGLGRRMVDCRSWWFGLMPLQFHCRIKCMEIVKKAQKRC